MLRLTLPHLDRSPRRPRRSTHGTGGVIFHWPATTTGVTVTAMHLRLATPADAPAVSRLYYETVRVTNASDHSPAQIAAWAPAVYPRQFWLDRWGPYQVFLAEDHARLLGFLEFDPRCGHLDCCYVHHACQRRGVGTALLRRAEQLADQLGLPRLHAEVCTTARPFFLAHGFTILRQRTTHYRGETFLLADMAKPRRAQISSLAS